MDRKIFLGLAGAAVVAAGLWFGTGGARKPAVSQDGAAAAPAPQTPSTGALVAVTMPAELSEPARIGQTAFNAVCAACHGEYGAGRDGYGPPLIHKIYEPSHHGDMSFQLAVQNGVRAHHWKFGNMPAQSGLTAADVTAIVAFVREVQRENGIN